MFLVGAVIYRKHRNDRGNILRWVSSVRGYLYKQNKQLCFLLIDAVEHANCWILSFTNLVAQLTFWGLPLRIACYWAAEIRTRYIRLLLASDRNDERISTLTQGLFNVIHYHIGKMQCNYKKNLNLSGRSSQSLRHVQASTSLFELVRQRSTKLNCKKAWAASKQYKFGPRRRHN